MLYRILADIVVAVHLLWILFLFTGAFWGRKHRPVRWAHGGGILFAVISQIFGWYCPLTHLEVWLRSRQGLEVYPGSFIIHYMEKLVYVQVTPGLIFAVTLVLAAVNIWIYGRALKKPVA